MEVKFYEIFAPPIWAQLTLDHGGLNRSPRDALQHALDARKLGLAEIVKSPTGMTTEYVYDLTGVIIEEAGADQFTQQGLGTLARTLRFSPYPYASHAVASASIRGTTSPASSGPKPDEELPDIQVARYALRTFNLNQGALGSLFRSAHTWNGGGAQAICGHTPPCDRPPSREHRCGLYGTLTLDQLVHEYGSFAPYCVAVFAAEGRTMLGTKGLRTEAARIVAYWCATVTEKQVFDTHAPEARHFETIEELLAEYKFPPWQPTPYRPSMFTPYDPEPRHPWPSMGRPPRAAGRRVGKSTFFTPTPGPAAGTSQPTATSRDTFAALTKAATPAGKGALVDLLGGLGVSYTVTVHGSVRAPVTPVLCGKCAQPVDAQGHCANPHIG